jgi:kynureninase
VQQRLPGRVQVITPADPAARGAALSLRLLGLARDRARAVFEGIRRRGILPDWREPDVIRAAPAPFYNGYADAWRFVDALQAELDT